ncbi:MAG: acetyl-CoA C-acetyltransferase [Vicinamibacterales bacterium]|nr:acetyl-CoA C-acetyltransferase [Vicinamibacterales bacterium]RUA00673.1 MAG: acetyl-CoA C-acyltransferase [Candidatus Neomarinimicrobiota bacterium]HIN11272.1 acetyl-CoA C-acetyltransferase [Acidobacteriota bacterium]
MRESVIVSAVRLPTGKFLGSLKSLPAPELGAKVVREAVSRAGIEPGLVDECIMGNVVSAGAGQAPARQAALQGGLGDHVASLTINKVCGSGLKAVMLAAQGIATGDIDIAVAGGMESMSNCPYMLPRAREGFRMGNAEVVDSMVHDGLWCSLEHWHMGLAGEAVADRYAVSREDQDAFAAASHHKAAQAIRECWFKDEILPVEVPQRKGDPIRLEYDESVRPDTSADALGRLRPAFKKDGGSVTAGNAPGVNDGAAAVVVMAAEKADELGIAPMARIVGQAVSGLSPKWILMTPVQAVQKLMAKVGWTLDDVDLFELNEAFSVQAIAVIRELGLDPEKVNVHGGAVALGHPIGASGARVLTTLLYAMRRRGATRGVATLCLGGGNGVALAVERAG